MEEDRNSFFSSPQSFEGSDETSQHCNDNSSTQHLASGDEMSDDFIDTGARPKMLSNIIDDSPLQNQIQRNKECKNHISLKYLQVSLITFSVLIILNYK